MHSVSYINTEFIIKQFRIPLFYSNTAKNKIFRITQIFCQNSYREKYFFTVTHTLSLYKFMFNLCLVFSDNSVIIIHTSFCIFLYIPSFQFFYKKNWDFPVLLNELLTTDNCRMKFSCLCLRELNQCIPLLICA